MKFYRRPILIAATFIFALSTYSAVDLAADPPANGAAFLAGKERAVWVSNRVARFRKTPTGARIRAVGLGEVFEVIGEQDSFFKVKDGDGNIGWLRKSDTSAKWILVEKKRRLLTFYDMKTEIGRWRIDLGVDPVGDKVMRGDLAPGHYRTPEGEFYVARKVPNSNFYRAFLISYPDIEVAEKGLKSGLINRAQYNAIVNAQRARRVPPQNTKLGSYLEIHGDGSGGLQDWTLGCIAVKNAAMDAMWDKIKVGAPIVIVP